MGGPKVGRVRQWQAPAISKLAAYAASLKP
jgi:hypothetical protein